MDDAPRPCGSGLPEDEVKPIVVAVSLLLAACGAGSTDVDVSAGDPAAGQRAFGAHCTACHGTDGDGTVSGPPLVGADAREITTQQVVEAVRRGVTTDRWSGSPMPALPAVTDEDLADIVAYLRQLRGVSPDPSSSSP